jgi:hypothetical protein
LQQQQQHAAARHLAQLQRHVGGHVWGGRLAALPPWGNLRQPDDRLCELSAAFQAALRAAAALVVALLLQLDGLAPGGAAQASVAEDRLLEFVRQMEVKVDSAVEAVKDAASQVSWPLRASHAASRLRYNPPSRACTHTGPLDIQLTPLPAGLR